MKYHFKSTRVAIKKTIHICKSAEKVKLSYIAGGNIKQYNTLENSLAIPQNVKHRVDFPGNPAVKTSCSHAGSTSLIPGQGTKILRFTRHGQKTKNKHRVAIRLSNSTTR